MKLNPFKLERFFAQYEFHAPYLLCSSDCESLSVGELLSLEKGSAAELNKLWLGYTESQGSPLLRGEIAKLYHGIKPEQIMVFAGAEEGIFVTMNSLLTLGDHIIVQSPGYQSLFEVARSLGCEVSSWMMNENAGWELDISFLKKTLKRNTKAIVINFPHNPTGYLPSRKLFDQIIEFAREHHLFIFSDEVYRLLEYDDTTTLPPIADCYEKGISLGVMSKTFGLAGLRIGWIVTKEKKLFSDIATFKDFTSICNSAPSEFLSVLSLRHKEKLVKRNLGIIQSNLKLLDQFFAQYSHLFSWVRPKAGSIGFPKIQFNQSALDFCTDLVAKKGVLLLPSEMYHFGQQHLRIGFGRNNMPQALQRLEEYVRENLSS